ncbi:unnamed protein product [Aspergillus oryzae RIB40]|uniref:DNA, SC166 n=1 Tax=Aspergillus oryzae (strain ATCC 42149 / RIB 40) TaxID=510516 RepID=Q2U9T0_ASPOR|nr:LOW QUALITY PROTEIN: unnamed protein product [Aspergillus oryzae RIB40]BAE61685.1 unnamed protein product [Aspergillus oryzae RIB40]
MQNELRNGNYQSKHSCLAAGQTAVFRLVVPFSRVRHFLPPLTHSINLPVTVSGSEPAVLSKTNSSENTTKKRKRETIRESPFAKLTRLVAKRLPNIIQFCESKASLSDILQNEQELQFADKRVDHLKQVDGNKTPSEEQKLLKGLSQLSLAEQFTAWEIENGWKSRVDTLYDEIRVARTEGQNGTCQMCRKNDSIRQGTWIS